MVEPAASLDFDIQALVLRQILRLRERGLGIVLAMHDPDQASTCATSAAPLQQGRIIAQGPPEDALTPGELSEVHGTGVQVDRFSDGRVVVTPALDL
jgi:iron complex transport system ATP-binding protein